MDFHRASAGVVARFAYLPTMKSVDFLFDTIEIAIWSTVEQGLAITAGNLATLRPLLRFIGQGFSVASEEAPSDITSYGKGSETSSQHYRSQPIPTPVSSGQKMAMETHLRDLEAA